MDMKFPAIDITITDWNDERINYIIWDSKFFYRHSKSYFKKHCLNHLLVDSAGNVFKMVGIRSIVFWKKIIPFLPKYEILFANSGKLSFEELQIIITEKINSNKFAEAIMLDDIKRAVTIEEIFNVLTRPQ